jgi:hypothetical protein
MKNKLILFAVAFLLLLNLSSAIVSHYQETILSPENSHITRKVTSVFWVMGDLELQSQGSFWDWFFLTNPLFPLNPPSSPITLQDVITSDELLEVEIDYSMYPQLWNSKNVEYKIENCTFTINYFEHKLNGSYVYYNETITKSDADIMNKKYFVRLNQRDGISVFMDCYFLDQNKRILDTPTELSIKLPTTECKSCQYYKWSVQDRQIAKAKILGNNVVSVWQYIKKIVDLNFEIILAGFWFLMIVLLIAGILAIFVGIYYVYQFFNKLARGIK